MVEHVDLKGKKYVSKHDTTIISPHPAWVECLNCGARVWGAGINQRPDGTEVIFTAHGDGFHPYYLPFDERHFPHHDNCPNKFRLNLDDIE